MRGGKNLARVVQHSGDRLRRLAVTTRWCFRRQELVNHDEDAFDHLLTGSGYTWIAIMSVYKQVVQLKDVNSFFGNLKNGGMYEGIWGNVTDDNRGLDRIT